jgi:Tol biopolymer transport system component
MGGVPSDTGGVSELGGASVTAGGTEAGGAFDSGVNTGATLGLGGNSEASGTIEFGGANTGGSSEVGGNSETGGSTNAATGGAAVTGGTTARPSTCDWASPTRAGLSVAAANEQWSPNLSVDDLTLFFSVYDGQNNKIYSATRTAKGASFGIPTHVTVSGGAGPAGPAQQQSPFLSHDGLTLYFVATSSLGTDKDIWYATRSTTTGSFTNAQALASVNSTKDDLRPWVSDDELTIYFASLRPGGSGDADIWTASRATRTSTFSTPVNVESINSTSRDSSPFLTPDLLTIYFSSSRPGGNGERDIWRAKRASAQGIFGAPAIVASIDSIALDSDVALSHDGTELFFTSESSGATLIWRATLACVDNGL